MIERFEAIERGGKKYLIEKHPRVLRAPIWYLYEKSARLKIHCLIPQVGSSYVLFKAKWLKGKDVKEQISNLLKHKEFEVNEDNFKGRFIIASNSNHPSNASHKFMSGLVVQISKLE